MFTWDSYRLSSNSTPHFAPPATFKSAKATRGDLLEGAGIYTSTLLARLLVEGCWTLTGLNW